MSGILDQRMQQIQSLPLVPQSIPLLQQMASNPADPNAQLAAFLRLNELKQAQQAMQSQQAMEQGAGLPSIKDQTVQAVGTMGQQMQAQQQGIQQLTQAAGQQQQAPVAMAEGGLPEDYPEPLAVREGRRSPQPAAPKTEDERINWMREVERIYRDEDTGPKRLTLDEAMKAEAGLASPRSEEQYQFLKAQQAQADELAKKEAAMNLYRSMIAGAEASRGQGGGLRGLASIIGGMGKDYGDRHIATQEDAMKRAQALRAKQAEIEDARRKELLEVVGTRVDESGKSAEEAGKRRDTRARIAQSMAEREASRDSQLAVANAYARSRTAGGTKPLDVLKAQASTINNELSKVQTALYRNPVPLPPEDRARLTQQEAELMQQLEQTRQEIRAVGSGSTASAPSAAPAPTGRPAGGKVMTMADVQATARASGRTPEEVKAAAQAKGYVIK